MSSFDEAITIITRRVYDEGPGIEQLMHSMAGAAFLFGLEFHFGSDDAHGDQLEPDSEHEAITGLDPLIDEFLERFITEECQDAISEEAANEELSRIDSCIAIVVTSYIAHHAKDIDVVELEADRLNHAVAITTWTLRLSLRLVLRDEELARVYWDEACLARPDR